MLDSLTNSTQECKVDSTRLTFEKFKSNFAKIEFLNSCNAYGHHPFQLIAVTADGQNEINSLAGLRMENVIDRVRHYLKAKAKEIFLTIDLPAGGGIPNDFIYVLHIIDGEKANVAVVEYSTGTGIIICDSNGEQYSLVETIEGYFLPSVKTND